MNTVKNAKITKNSKIRHPQKKGMSDKAEGHQEKLQKLRILRKLRKLQKIVKFVIPRKKGTSDK